MLKLIWTCLILFLCLTAHADPDGPRWYYLGTHIERTDDTGTYNDLPTGTIGAIDLSYGSTDCLFFTSAAPVAGRAHSLIGTDLDTPLSATEVDLWEEKTGITVIGSGPTIRDLLAKNLGEWSDPLGVTAAKPITPTRAGELEIHLGGHSVIWNRKYQGLTDPIFVKHQTLVREEFKRIADEELRGKFMSTRLEKYGISDKDLFTPIGETITLRKPETTLSESFDTSNSDTLGPDLSWDEAFGDVDVESNQGVHPGDSTPGSARTVGTLSSDDHSVKIDFDFDTGSGIAYGGPVARFDPDVTSTANREGYYFRYRLDTDDLHLACLDAGTFNTLAVDTSYGGGYPFEMLIDCDGSTIRGLIDSVEEFSVTDSTLTGYVNTGFYGFASSGNKTFVDNFEATDLSSSSIIPGLLAQYRRRF